VPVPGREDRADIRLYHQDETFEQQAQRILDQLSSSAVSPDKVSAEVPSEENEDADTVITAGALATANAAETEPRAEAAAGGGDSPELPPPAGPPETSELSDEAPRPFGVTRFSTDPEYELDPPVPGHVIDVAATVALVRHGGFVDTIDHIDGEYQRVELECRTPEGSVSFDVSTLPGITAAFNDNDVNTTHHIYYADGVDMTRRYDVDVAAYTALSEQPGDVSPIEEVEDVMIYTTMDLTMGSGARVVGGREIEYVNDLLERAEPATVPFATLADAAQERRDIETIGKAETAQAYDLLSERIQATLGDPNSGYTVYEEPLGDQYRVGGKMKITEDDGNFTEVDIGLQRWPSGEFTPYVKIKHTEPTTKTPPPRIRPHLAPPVQEVRLEYVGDIFWKELRGMVDEDLIEGPRGLALTFDIPHFSNAGMKEALLLRNFIRKPRRS
jgi:hypothetical protein